MIFSLSVCVCAHSFSFYHEDATLKRLALNVEGSLNEAFLFSNTKWVKGGAGEGKER